MLQLLIHIILHSIYLLLVELIAQKELAQIDEEVIAFECKHWELEEWSKLPERVQGPTFEAGGHRWNVLLFPKGNGVPDYSSIYLEFTDAKTSSPDNYACAQFVISLSKPSDPTVTFTHCMQIYIIFFFIHLSH